MEEGLEAVVTVEAKLDRELEVLDCEVEAVVEIFGAEDIVVTSSPLFITVVVSSMSLVSFCACADITSTATKIAVLNILYQICQSFSGQYAAEKFSLLRKKSHFFGKLVWNFLFQKC